MFKYFLKVAALLVTAAFCAQLCASATLSQFEGFSFIAEPPNLNEGERVYLVADGYATCLDVSTGQEIWSIKAPGLGLQENSGAGPVLAGSNIVYMAGGGFFTAYALNKNIGNTQWMLDRRSPVLASDSNTVFISTQGGLGIIAIDNETGKVKWEHRAVKIGGTLKKILYTQDRLYTNSPYVWDATKGEIVTKLAFAPRAVAANEKYVFVIGRDAPVTALSPRTGKPLWKADIPLATSVDHSMEQNIFASNKYVAAVAYENVVGVAKRADIAIYNADDGHLLWNMIIKSNDGLASNLTSVDDKNLYVFGAVDAGAIDSNLTAYNAQNGKPLWKYEDAPVTFMGPIASLKNTVLFYGFNSKLHRVILYALNKEDGKIRWKFEPRT